MTAESDRSADLRLVHGGRRLSHTHEDCPRIARLEGAAVENRLLAGAALVVAVIALFVGLLGSTGALREGTSTLPAPGAQR